jgi:EAL domain-containing protein (putative c-di-GMP-specific phosphodiesterase class I)
VQVTASIGVSAFPLDGEEPLTLLTRAEVAMKHVREKGGGGYEFFQESLNAKAQRCAEVEVELRGILERGELQVHYQPRIDLEGNRIAAVEALARWPENLERIEPTEFIDVAEKADLAVPLGEAVLRTACGHVMEMMRKGLPTLGISMNLTAAQLQQPGIASQLKRIVTQAHVEPGQVELEVTERALLGDSERFAPRLRDLRDAGFRIALDAFGTGISSLATLSSLPIDTIKIDRSCVAELGARPGGTLAEGIAKLGLAMSLRVVAVGVEESAQLDRMSAQGCHEAQGFLLGRPAAFDRFVEWAEGWEARSDAPVMDTVADSLRRRSTDR